MLSGNFGGNKSKSMTSMASAAKSPVGGSNGGNKGSPMHMGGTGGIPRNNSNPAWSPSHQPNYGMCNFFVQ